MPVEEDDLHDLSDARSTSRRAAAAVAGGSMN